VFISCADAVVYIEFICFLLYKNKKSLLNKLCALAVAPFLIWSSAMIFFNAAEQARDAMLWLNVASFGWCSFPVFVLFFFLEFTGYAEISKKPLLCAACALSAVYCICLARLLHLDVECVAKFTFVRGNLSKRVFVIKNTDFYPCTFSETGQRPCSYL